MQSVSFIKIDSTARSLTTYFWKQSGKDRESGLSYVNTKVVNDSRSGVKIEAGLTPQAKVKQRLRLNQNTSPDLSGRRLRKRNVEELREQINRTGKCAKPSETRNGATILIVHTS